MSIIPAFPECLCRPQLAREAMREAKQHGALVSIDLASFECVANCKQPLLELLQAGLIDLVFANEEEAIALLEVVAGQEGAAAGAAAGAFSVDWAFTEV
jgi:sugar/nucleoside kinase (ribokinase family)